MQRVEQQRAMAAAAANDGVLGAPEEASEGRAPKKPRSQLQPRLADWPPRPPAPPQGPVEVAPAATAAEGAAAAAGAAAAGAAAGAVAPLRPLPQVQHQQHQHQHQQLKQQAPRHLKRPALPMLGRQARATRRQPGGVLPARDGAQQLGAPPPCPQPVAGTLPQEARERQALQLQGVQSQQRPQRPPSQQQDGQARLQQQAPHPQLPALPARAAQSVAGIAVVPAALRMLHHGATRVPARAPAPPHQQAVPPPQHQHVPPQQHPQVTPPLHQHVLPPQHQHQEASSAAEPSDVLLELAEAVESPLAVAVGLCFEHLLYFANLWERMAPREQANRAKLLRRYLSASQYGNRGCAQRGASRFASPSLGTFGRLQAAQQSAWHLRIGRGGKPGPAMAAAKQNYRVRQRLEVFYTGGSVRLSADGRLLACACADEVKVVDAASGTVVQTLPGDSEPVTALGFSPNAHLLFTASRSLQLRCWSLDGGAPAALRSYKGHKAPVADMAVHASGGLLATGSADRTVRVWDVDGGFCTHSFTGHSGVVLRVLFHPKELMVISAGDDAEVRVWDLVTKSCAAVLKGHFSAVTALSLSPDGWTLLCGGRDSVVTVWNLSNHSKLATVPVYEALEGLAYLPPGAPFPGLPASSGGRQGGKAATPVCFATGGERGVVQLWRADTGKCVYEQPAAAAAAASAAGGIVELELLPGGAGLLTATQDCRLLMHAPAGGDLAVTRQLIGNNDEVTDMRFLTLGGGDGGDGGGDGAPTHLAVSTNSDQIRLFDARTLSCTATLAGHTDTVLALDALRLPGGAALLASAGKDASLRLWSLPAARCVGVGAGHVSAVSCVAFARRGGNFVATGGADKLLKVWDTAALAMDAAAPAKLRVTAAVAAHDKDINAVAVAPNDSVICTGSQDRTAKVWQLPDLVLSLTLKGHKRGIWAVAFSPVDKAVATASGDKTVRLWSLADGSCLRTFEGHLSSVLRLDFLSAGTQILSAGADGLLKLWSVRLSECVNTFDAHEDKVWALALDGRNADVLASGGGDGAVAIWEDCTSADADEAAAATAVAVLKEQDLANALQMEDWERAAALAFEMRHPGRLLRVVRQALERGQQEGGRILSRLAGGMSADDLRQCLEYCREWNSNAKNCHAAQAMLQAVLRQRRPQELLSVPGLGGVLEGMLPYTQRHFARADRLLRSTFLCDYIVGAMGSMAPAGDDAGVGGAQLVAGAAPAGTHQLEAQQQAPEPRRRPARALLGAAPLPAPAAAPAAAAAALAVAAAQQPEQQQQQQSEEEREEDVAEPAANGHSQAQPNGTADDASGDSSSDEEDGRGMAAAAAAAAAAAKKRPARVPAAKTPAAKPSSSKAKVPPATAGKAVRQQAAAKKRRLSA